MSTAQTHGPRPVPAPRRVVISGDGDAILLVQEVELRVDSRRLRMHSVEFDKFFERSGNARGLQRASVAEPYSMLLSDASPEAMEMICRLLHNQADSLTSRLSPANFSEFSRLAAKYECVAKARGAAQRWISSFDHTASSPYQTPTLLCLIKGAWYLEHASLFKELTGYWMDNRGALGGMGANLGIATVVDMAMRDVMQRGTSEQTHLQRAVNDFVNAMCEHAADTEEHEEMRSSERPGDIRYMCTYHLDIRDVCFEKLREVRIWPRNQQSEDPDQLCDAIKSLEPFEDMPRELSPCDHYKCRRNIQEEIKADVREMCGAAEPKYPGLCLQCCKLGGRYDCRC